MAQGDVVLFNQAKEELGLGDWNLSTDTVRLALITSTVTPTATTADPRWGAGGSTNLSTNEVSAGGNYTAGGQDITNTWTRATGTVTFDGADISWVQNGSNPTDARWGILYDDTDSENKCIAFVDLGSVFDMSGGDLNVNWNASGIFTLS